MNIVFRLFAHKWINREFSTTEQLMWRVIFFFKFNVNKLYESIRDVLVFFFLAFWEATLDLEDN